MNEYSFGTTPKRIYGISHGSPVAIGMKELNEKSTGKINIPIIYLFRFEDGPTF